MATTYVDPVARLRPTNAPGVAVGIIRVSQRGDRDGEAFLSPDQQRETITQACEREGLRLVAVFDETDSISGGLPLSRRPGLSQAVRAVEADEAEVIVAAYFNRLFRSL